MVYFVQRVAIYEFGERDIRPAVSSLPGGSEVSNEEENRCDLRLAVEPTAVATGLQNSNTLGPLADLMSPKPE